MSSGPSRFSRSPESGPSDPYAPLRRATFRGFLAGALSTNLSNQVLAVTAGYYLYEVTHSAWALALVGLMSYLPVLLLSLPAGWVSDHYSRRGVLGAALCLQGSAAAGLAALMELHGPRWPWYPLLFVAGCGRALQSPAAASLYPQLLEVDDVPRAVSWNSATFQVGTTAGLFLGGFLIQWIGVTRTLYFVLAGPAVFLILLPGLAPLRETISTASESAREKLLGGLHFVWRQKPILGALSVDFVAVLFGGVVGILPMFAHDILRCGPVGLGALNAVPFLGAFLVSFRLAHRPVLARPGRSMLLAVAGFGLCMLVFGLSRNFGLSLLVLCAAGMLDQVSVYVRQTMVQLRTPEPLRGRVQAVNFLFIGSSNELGEVESGVTAGLMGPVGSVLAGGLAVLVVVFCARFVFSQLWDMPSLGGESDA